MSSKVVLEKRRPDTVISECRIRRRDASEKRGLAVSVKALGESVHQDPRINSCGAIAMVFQLRCDSPSSGTTRSHHRLRPAGRSRWQHIWPGGQLPVIFIAARAAGIGPTPTTWA